MPLQIHIKSGQHLWWGGPGRRLRQVTCEVPAPWQCSDSILEKTKYLGCNKDGHILFASFCFSALGWSWNSIPMDPPFQCLPFWQIQSPWVGKSHVFQFVVSNSCCRRRPEHHRGFGQHGQLQPKACWAMEPTIPSMDGRCKIWVKPLTS